VPAASGNGAPAHRAAVLGSPIAHSLSPALHNAAYRELGLAGWAYEAIECDEARLPALLASLGPDWAGLSLTMPLKRAVLPLLDRADPLVTVAGGANTVLLAGHERSGYNTDVPGMVAALAEAGAGADGRVLLLGGGATACSAIVALQRAGAQSVTAAVRTPPAAQALAAVAGRVGLPLRTVPFGPGRDRDEWLAGSAARPWRLLVSTVPAGAADSYADLLAGGALAADAVFDVVYHPWPTRLAGTAAAAGTRVIGGFSLLLHQAAEQFRLMTGRPAPVEAMRAAGLAELAART
jgi:shikimate dehydrogenase